MSSITSKIESLLDLNRPQIEASSKSAKHLGLWQYLQDSENLLVEVMQQKSPEYGHPGHIEYGLTLYLLNNSIPNKYQWLHRALKCLGMPNSSISVNELQNWQHQLADGGIIYGDGTMLSFAKYAQLDPGWIEAAICYVLVQHDIIKKHKFGKTPTTTNIPATNKIPTPAEITIAILGDWGTGDDYKDGELPQTPSLSVIQLANQMKPDVAIHLGDVYYAGIESNEMDKFVQLWDAGASYNYTLNSNHEMYDGAKGYFIKALGEGSPFNKQDNTSYFAVCYGKWLIIGLDSAYYDTSSMYMTGSITDENQLNFLKDASTEAAEKGLEIIIMTHHCPLSTDGTETTPLWDDVTTALGKAPSYWYFGHMHNGVAYSTKAASGKSCLCRCVGHGAIPFGNGNWLANQNTIDWYATTPLTGGGEELKNRVQNGFALVTLTPDTLTEVFYNQDGSVAFSTDD